MATMKTVAISGSTGTIGVTLTNYLTGRGINCVLLNVPEFVHKEDYRDLDRIEFVDCPLDGYLSLSQSPSCPKADAFIHLAWAGTFGPKRDDVALQLANIQGTLDAIELAKAMGCAAFVGAGSQAEFGKGVEKTPRETLPVTGYGIAKLCAGQLGKMKAAQVGIRFNWVRIFSVFGPHMSVGSLVPYVVDCLLKGEEAALTPCEQIWDFLYSEDAVAALAAVAERGVDGKTYELGSGTTGTLRYFISQVPAILGVEDRIRFGVVPYPANQVMSMCAEVGELMRDTGWKPIHTFADGVRAIASSLATH